MPFHVFVDAATTVVLVLADVSCVAADTEAKERGSTVTGAPTISHDRVLAPTAALLPRS